jgi:ATP-binding cassette subfamily C protein LapB
MAQNFVEDFHKNIEGRRVDDLLECLLFLSQYYERISSRESLTAGLPIHGDEMTPSMFMKASKKIGLISKPICRKIEEIKNDILPAVVLLEENKASVLLKIDREKEQVLLAFPENDMGEQWVSYEDFYHGYGKNQDYTKNIIIVKAAYNFERKVDRDIEIEEPKQWFWNVMKQNVKIYSYVIVAAIFINLFVLFIPLFTMNVYDRVLPNKAIDTLTVLVVGISMIIIFDLILKLIRSYFLEQASQKADIKMSTKIFDQLLNIKLDSKPASTGLFVSRLQSFESVREFFTAATLAVLVDIPFIILFIAVIFYIGGPLGFVSVVTVIVVLIFSFFMQKPIKKAILNSAKEDQIKQTTLTEAVTGLEIIKGVRAQNRMFKHWDRSISQTSYYGNKSIHLSQIVTYVTGFVSQFSSIAIVAFGVVLASNGELTMGGIIAAMLLNSRVIAPVSQIVGMIIRIDRTMLSLNNIDEIMQMPVERDRLQKYLSRPSLSGDIIFKDVHFSYKERNFDTLKNINFTIPKGEKVGIVGKVGSGKSSLAKLLLNLYEPTKGSILIDQTDVRQIDPVDLRRAIGYVPQEPFLFMGTIKDNITIGEPFATDESILEASKIAGVHEILGKHEAGYDLTVGERGEGLSGGERQAVTLARAILSKPEILILDEPTNAMDELSENKFIKQLEQIIKDKTVIIISHKPSILRLVDRIIVLDNGQIVADDAKKNVLTKFQKPKNTLQKGNENVKI